jgi:hypothetical protein
MTNQGKSTAKLFVDGLRSSGSQPGFLLFRRREVPEEKIIKGYEHDEGSG